MKHVVLQMCRTKMMTVYWMAILYQTTYLHPRIAILAM